MNNLTYHLKELEKEQSKPKISRREEIRSERKKHYKHMKYNKDTIKISEVCVINKSILTYGKTRRKEYISRKYKMSNEREV